MPYNAIFEPPQQPPPPPCDECPWPWIFKFKFEDLLLLILFEYDIKCINVIDSNVQINAKKIGFP